MSDDPTHSYLKILGRRIWSEANDLKRTPGALADETGISLDTVRAIISGSADESAALGLAAKMTEIYPISAAQLVVDKNDTKAGVLVMRSAASEQSSRVFERRDKNGGLSPYYEYRDTAMSRLGPFKPEWIQPLRVVADAAPENPDVAYNNGHLMHQLTFFIGEVNFYWKTDGVARSVELNTGHSNYITPYVAHSFTSRNPDKLGLIIAVTYGDQLHRALPDLSHLGPEEADRLAGDLRDPRNAFHAHLARLQASESLSDRELVERLTRAGIDQSKGDRLVSGTAMPSLDDLELLATALNVRPADLQVSSLSREDEVVVRTDGESRIYPDGNHPACRLTELARCRHQPNLKSFEITMIDGAAEFRHSLHEYVYNYGDAPVALTWDTDCNDILNPGDSAYIGPMVTHAFERISGHGEGHLAAVRAPGALSDSVFSEYSTYPAEGRERATGEDRTWF